MDMMSSTNTKSVEEFASYIQKRVQSNTQNWWEIAEAFAEARDMYGSGSSAFKQLREMVRLSESTITKLMAIVSSDRLRKYAVSLSSVHSWGTLYAISTLNEEQFAEFKLKYKLDDPDTLAPFITQGEVSRFRKEPSERSVFRGYAMIQVDDEAVKGGLLSGSEFDELQKLLSQMEALSSYIAVKRMVNDEKEELSRLSRIEEKVQQIIRRKYLEGINATMARHKCRQDEKQSAFKARVLGKNQEELLGDLRSDAHEAFMYLGLDYSMGAFYKEAESEVNDAELARMDRFAKKVLSRLPVVKEPEEDEEAALEQLMKDYAAKGGFKKFDKSRFKDWT